MRSAGSIFLPALLSLAVFLGATPRVDACAPLDEPNPPPQTPEIEAQAAALFAEGKTLEEKGDIAGALQKYLASRALLPRKSNTINAARCLDLLGRSDEALAMYETALASYRAGLEPSLLAGIRKDMIKLRRLVAAVTFKDAKGKVQIDGKACGALPRKRAMYLLPGRRVLRLEAPGEPATTQVLLLNAGETLTVRFSEEEQPPPPPPLAEPPRLPPQRHEASREGWIAEGVAGFAAGPTLGSDPERAANLRCGSDCPAVLGGIFVARGGYLFTNGISLSLGIGWLEVASSFLRRERGSFVVEDGTPVDIMYEFQETVRLRGPFMGPTFGYRREIGRFGLAFRGTFGLLSASSADELESGIVKGGAFPPADVRVTGKADVRSIPSFVMPEIGVDYSLGKLRLGFSLGVMIVLSDGDPFAKRPYGVYPTRCNDGSSHDPGCAPWPDEPLPGGTSFRVTQIVAPQIVVGFSP